ncbi:MAG TPA: hypothetical protein VMG30_06210 [Acidobacteriota bacterium]|nr:hypothetical protein [Acidobacteriota bacterium]
MNSDFKLMREEMETIIRGNASSKKWDICTADPRMIRKMEKQGYTLDQRENPWGYVSFTVPFDRVKIMKAEKRKTGFARRLDSPEYPTGRHSGVVFSDNFGKKVSR